MSLSAGLDGGEASERERKYGEEEQEDEEEELTT